jgi:hypothetical protein
MNMTDFGGDTEAVRTSETSVYFSQITQRCIPEGSLSSL